MTRAEFELITCQILRHLADVGKWYPLLEADDPLPRTVAVPTPAGEVTIDFSKCRQTTVAAASPPISDPTG